MQIPKETIKATLDCAGTRKSLNMLTFAKIKIDIKR